MGGWGALPGVPCRNPEPLCWDLKRQTRLVPAWELVPPLPWMETVLLISGSKAGKVRPVCVLPRLDLALTCVQTQGTQGGGL